MILNVTLSQKEFSCRLLYSLAYRTRHQVQTQGNHFTDTPKIRANYFRTLPGTKEYIGRVQRGERPRSLIGQSFP